MEVIIRRVEVYTDEKGRNTVLETRMADLTGWNSHEVLDQIIAYYYINEDGNGINYDVSSDNTRDLEVNGEIVLAYLDELDKVEPDTKAKEQFLKNEDGINRLGEKFDIMKQYYSIEQF